jgi:hypothetical protein
MEKPQVNTGRLINKQPLKKKISREEVKKLIAKLYERDSELVTGIFKNRENPASSSSLGSVSFGFKKWPQDDYIEYEFLDGERYTIPRAVAHHLNNQCYYTEYKRLQGEFGQAGVRNAMGDGKLRHHQMHTQKKVHRFEFHSLEYMDDDIDMYPADLVEVRAA